jgi:long-chain acyl-CoA synthetase
MSIRTLAELFLKSAGQGRPDLLLHKVAGSYRPIATAELVPKVQRLSKALQELGVARGDRVALMAENGPHWPLVDFATLCMGGVVVPIYPTLLPKDAAYIVNDSGAKVVFVQGPERLEGLLAQRAAMPGLQHIVLIDEGAAAGPGHSTLEAALARVDTVDPAAFEAEARKALPEDLATFIYTSGTTGNPKGVMLTHGNITSNLTDALQNLDIESEFTALSFLPLSHSFERTVDYIYFYRGCSIGYAESIQTIGQNLGEVKPHVFVAVPRVYEKVLSRINEGIAAAGGAKEKIFRWAVSVGRQALPELLAGRRPGGLLGLKLGVADKLVFSKIRERLGGRFAFAVSGGAPLSRDVAEFFWGAGVRIYEGYGLTETSPVLTINSHGATKLGSVGRAIPNVELRIAEDGEILARGPNIMKGYYNNPEATAEAIDADGWFHTGDIGHLDEDGFLFITDRKKELIVTAGGKNIAPAPIENALKSSRFIAQAVVIGDRRKFISALIVPDFEALRPWARANGVTFANDEQLVADPAVRKLIADEIAPVNAELAQYERIKAWDLLPRELTLETGELTPTQKVKRRVVNQSFASQIDRMYEGGAGE